jgi:hypothetical protein
MNSLLKKILKVLKSIAIGYALWLWYYMNKSYRERMKAEAKRRICICEHCPFFWPYARNCMICGCLCDVKTKCEFDLDENGISIDGCPEKFW